ncbi:hypothetical protein ACRHK7_06125 [Weissella tructae]|jgi:hypothetical protein|uniref:Uncharacterized protein n=2 Tax=Weissella TaxID=46255 RepID=A0A075TZ51_9LACO|nr:MULTISPECIES: hypothetical protein [Weissella]AIG65576.1 hypothetical protein WS08_0637 [Weissella tructae]AIM62891.1 hypothetical protein WS74_0639 [Weissella ceti]AIM64289.1 hypothetical protein WS105_0699 [Weissella ceti]QVV90708.1 hypothetical protein KHQ32_03460 [Weissella tructae]
MAFDFNGMKDQITDTAKNVANDVMTDKKADLENMAGDLMNKAKDTATNVANDVTSKFK